MNGHFFWRSKTLNFIEKVYTFILGIPILGLRIRLRRLLPLIKKYFKDKNSILDFGSGRGVFSIEMAKIFPNAIVEGIDFSNLKIEDSRHIVNKLHLNNCYFSSNDIKKINTKFDAILAIDVLEHIENDVEMCKIIYQKLNKDGIFLVHVPHKYRNLFGKKRINFDIEGHVRPGYLISEIENVVKTAGFKILDKGYTYSSIETLCNDISYIITRGSEKNKILYSIIFPFLLFLSYFGKFKKVTYGSGVFIVAQK